MDTDKTNTPIQPLTVLVVEDHDGLREAFTEILQVTGHCVIAADSAEAVCELPASRRFDIAVVDLGLPGEDGLSLVARLRETCPQLGIIMVTARDAVDDKLRGYSGGADMYLTKPADAEELLSALTALARRLSQETDDTDRYWLEPLQNRLITPAGEIIELSGRESQVLRALALAADATLETWQLLEVLQLEDSERAKQNLEVLVSRLRRKLKAQGVDPGALRAERLRGYILTLPIAIH